MGIHRQNQGGRTDEEIDSDGIGSGMPVTRGNGLSRFGQEVKLHGATTVVDRVVNPQKAAVEKATGLKLVVVGNATGRGLVDLVEGKCDVAMVSEPMDIAMEAAKTAGKDVSKSNLEFSVVKKDEIVFIIHPSNPVTSLTWEQIRDMHTGKITNWKQVGGKDMPVVVYTDTVTGGTRAMIKKVVLGGADYAPSCKALSAVKKVGEMVAMQEGAIGGLGKGFVQAGKDKVVQTKTIERPLGFVTVGSALGQSQEDDQRLQDRCVGVLRKEQSAKSSKRPFHQGGHAGPPDSFLELTCFKIKKTSP